MSPRLSLALCAPLVTACTVDPGADAAGTTAATTNDATTTDATTTDASATGPTDTAVPTTGDAPPAVPEFGATFTVIGTAADGLHAVRDLAFNPGAPDQLWTYNMLLHG